MPLQKHYKNMQMRSALSSELQGLSSVQISNTCNVHFSSIYALQLHRVFFMSPRMRREVQRFICIGTNFSVFTRNVEYGKYHEPIYRTLAKYSVSQGAHGIDIAAFQIFFPQVHFGRLPLVSLFIR